MTQKPKKTNKQAKCLNYIRDSGTASRIEISQELNLDKKTVSGIIDELLEANLIVHAGFKDSSAGRRQELLKINGSHSNFIGVDLGATHINGIITDLSGEILDRIYFELRPGLSLDLILEQLTTMTQRLMSSDKVTAKVSAIGVDVPGFINPESGVSLMAENIPSWKETNLRLLFESTFDKPVFFEDCSRALGIAEHLLGSGKYSENFFVLDVGYGIGMAIFINGELFSGCCFKSGEIGHTVIDPAGPLCSCGKRGCLETLASGQGIAAQAATAIKEGKSKILEELTHNKAHEVTAQDVALAASLKDEYSVSLLQISGYYIGVALSNALNILNPSCVILGGGLMGAGKILLDSIEKSIKNYTMMGIIDDVEIKTSTLGIDGSALGCALLSMEHVFSL